MAILSGIFFSFISVLCLMKGKSKGALRRLVIIAFSLFLVLVQVLFINDVLKLESKDFILISGSLSGIILILAFQKNEAW
ncbi:MAG: hypothetical protein JST42_00035 [Bacteroidetes bacterium]|nr:hypothetical protein [Bacteroidota bacterium]